MILRGGLVLAALVALSVASAGEAGAVARQVTCTLIGTPFQDVVDMSCSGDTISVVGTCDEPVEINLAGNNFACATGDGLPFTKLSITGTSSAVNNYTAGTDDVQALPVGNGEANSTCVSPGAPPINDSTPAGDDVLQAGPQIVDSGSNGVCETTAAGNDSQALPVGQGTPGTPCVTAGGNGTLESSASGDDMVVVNTITSGLNGICESTVIPGGPAFLITGNARNVTISNMTVGSATSHGIQVMSAHRVTLSGIRTAPSSAPLAFAFLDGINIDTASTRVRVVSSTLNSNLQDGVENGSTDGEVTSVTANDNGAVGIHVPGSNVMVNRCRADENTGTPFAQNEGYRFDGPGAIVEECTAKGNVVAQFRDAVGSTGVIHFRNTAGSSSATTVTGFSDDVQALPVGNGQPFSTCVSPFVFPTIMSMPAGDDVLQAGSLILDSGSNGVCETTANVNDAQTLPVGQGTPGTDCVTAGLNGTLGSPTSSDDMVVVNTITSGPDGICESTAVAPRAGFLEEGTGNRINTCTITKNGGHGVHLAGSGNALQLSTINQNVGDQVLITGDNNFVQSNSILRVSAPSVFASVLPAVHAPAGANSNFFDGNRVSLASGAVLGDGYTVPDPDNNGQRNSRTPSDPNDPPANLR